MVKRYETDYGRLLHKSVLHPLGFQKSKFVTYQYLAIAMGLSLTATWQNLHSPPQCTPIPHSSTQHTACQTDCTWVFE